MQATKPIESFSYLIDAIVGDLESASKIRIECLAMADPDFKSQKNIKIISVNGTGSASQFFHYMEHLRAGTMNNIRETLPQIAPADMEAFIDQVLRRVRKIGLSVMMTKTTGASGEWGETAQWATRSLSCRYQGRITAEPEIVREAIALTTRHAHIYYLVLKKLEDRINSCAGATLNIMVTSTGMPGTRPVKKFRLNCSVAFFCAMLRVLCDRNIVENPNVSELCRRIAAACCTSRQENLSPHSLRNCFDDPSAPALEELLAEVRIWEKYIMNFISRQGH